MLTKKSDLDRPPAPDETDDDDDGPDDHEDDGGRPEDVEVGVHVGEEGGEALVAEVGPDGDAEDAQGETLMWKGKSRSRYNSTVRLVSASKATVHVR